MSTTSSEPGVRALRKPYQESPNLGPFLRMHASYAKARPIWVDVQVVGAKGTGVTSLVYKVNSHSIGVIRPS